MCLSDRVTLLKIRFTKCVNNRREAFGLHVNANWPAWRSWNLSAMLYVCVDTTKTNNLYTPRIDDSHPILVPLAERSHRTWHLARSANQRSTVTSMRCAFQRILRRCSTRAHRNRDYKSVEEQPRRNCMLAADLGEYTFRS